jgi:hypothetical protein
VAQQWPVLDWLAMGIELSGALIMAFYMMSAVYSLATTRSARRAQFFVCQGAIIGLSFVTAATALKLIEMWTWNQIAMSASLFSPDCLEAGLHSRAEITGWIAKERRSNCCCAISHRLGGFFRCIV